jgi:uncharacterized protein (DUF58 family)
MTQAPNYLDPQTLAAIKGIELRARMVVEGLMSGQHRSPMQGVSVEFSQHRPYTMGDDLRFLDWKVYGKTDRLHIKQTIKETNLDLVILLDCSGSMGYTSLRDQPTGWTTDWSKWNHACCAAAAMANIALRQQDAVSLTLFADDVVGQTRLSNASDQWRNIAYLMVRTELVKESSDQPVPLDNTHNHTDLSAIFERTTARLTRRSLIVLISDLFDDPAHLEAGLSRVRFRGHDVVVLQVMDPAELDFAFRDPTDFLGLEGEGRLAMDPAALRQVYQSVVQEHLDAVEQTCRRFGFDYELLKTRDALGPPLSHFLAKRASLLAKL